MRDRAAAVVNEDGGVIMIHLFHFLRVIIDIHEKQHSHVIEQVLNFGVVKRQCGKGQVDSILLQTKRLSCV